MTVELDSTFAEAVGSQAIRITKGHQVCFWIKFASILKLISKYCKKERKGGEESITNLMVQVRLVERPLRSEAPCFMLGPTLWTRFRSITLKNLPH